MKSPGGFFMSFLGTFARILTSPVLVRRHSLFLLYPFSFFSLLSHVFSFLPRFPPFFHLSPVSFSHVFPSTFLWRSFQRLFLVFHIFSEVFYPLVIFGKTALFPFTRILTYSLPSLSLFSLFFSFRVFHKNRSISNLGVFSFLPLFSIMSPSSLSIHK